MSHESAELLLRGYHAFVDGDLAAIETMLDPDVEWVAAGESEAIVVNRDRVLEVVAERARPLRRAALAEPPLVPPRPLGRRRLHARRPGRARRGAPASRGGSRG